eukprot:4192111-Lingulodinium_polyedra.AAC.1
MRALLLRGLGDGQDARGRSEENAVVLPTGGADGPGKSREAAASQGDDGENAMPELRPVRALVARPG